MQMHNVPVILVTYIPNRILTLKCLMFIVWLHLDGNPMEIVLLILHQYMKLAVKEFSLAHKII
jgi:hypothetical protein